VRGKTGPHFSHVAQFIRFHLLSLCTIFGVATDRTRRNKLNRSALILASVMVLLVASAFPCGTLGRAAQSFVDTASGAGIGLQVQYAQFRSSGLFDRGTCEFSCRNVYGAPSTWTGDRTQSDANVDYLRCTNQCDVRDWNELERCKKPY